ncbi:MepB family protein [Myxococcus landrumensis]|uniref:MepB family protein n=1 Tax=Myxococcus landrumensis TaxID=2813577 RepID=A0ABX7NFS2_9BACT|nr:MepB family protein [Myxococcus landrumus]QSQ17681.1 MepB family protein [Myxococcus landrumus]
MSTHLVDPASGPLPHDLLAAIRDAYAPAGLSVTTPASREVESAEYGACRLALDGRTVVFRVAKTTPTKVGQFVTLWKRPTPDAEIAPLDSGDGVDLVVVSVGDADHRGQFVFPQKTLVDKGVMSRAHQGGKRAIRVYPPWSKPVVAEAIRTQKWQLTYFLPLPLEGSTQPARVRELFAR